ncbi:MAG TPA: hypothetical protein VK828_00295 [Terriglobales bacterium]|nr:hypothetical protein [Terriglobales bacterium]
MAFDLIDEVEIVVIGTPPFNIDFASQKLLAEEIMGAILRLIARRVYG